MQRTIRSLESLTLVFAVAMLAAAGCTDDRVLADDGESSGTLPSTGSTTAVGSTSGPIDPSTVTTIDLDGTSSDDTTGGGFVPPEDLGGMQLECDIWAQDCPSGEKCMPWANDGNVWNATRCTPIAEDPGVAGEPCHVEGSGVSGIDDCELGAMCWDVNIRTNEGTCVDICLGTFEAYYCEDPSEYCAQGGDGLITLCLPLCDPLEQDCPGGQACVGIQDAWSCAPDASGDMGAYGDSCEFVNACDPGLACLDSSTVPPGLPCEGAGGCCTEVCDITDPLGDQQCAGAAEGQTCQAWYEEGEAPAILEHVGVCALP
jgi:hypothetical protein